MTRALPFTLSIAIGLALVGIGCTESESFDPNRGEAGSPGAQAGTTGAAGGLGAAGATGGDGVAGTPDVSGTGSAGGTTGAGVGGGAGGSSVGGGSGTAGATGAAGNAGSAGAAGGRGGGTGAAGHTGAGGHAGTTGAGGTTGAAGATGTGGTTGTGGVKGAGGTPGTGGAIGVGGSTGALGYAADIEPIFVVRCAPCHTATTGGYLSLKMGAGYSNLLTGAVWESTCGLLLPANPKRVIPGDPDHSELYIKVSYTVAQLSAKSCRNLMPEPPNPALSAAEIAKIHDWIAQGAKP